MKQLFKPGDKKLYKKIITSQDLASFHGQVVHEVCSTFSLCRDMEWTTRQFVMEMRDEDEEGIGTCLQIEHHAPAFEGEEIVFTGTIERMNGNELICRVDAHVGKRLIATGSTGQKILKREKINQILRRHG